MPSHVEEILDYIEDMTSKSVTDKKTLASLTDEEKIDVESSADTFDYQVLHAFANRYPDADIDYEEDRGLVRVGNREFELEVEAWQELAEEYEDVNAVAECVAVMEMHFSDEIE